MPGHPSGALASCEARLLRTFREAGQQREVADKIALRASRRLGQIPDSEHVVDGARLPPPCTGMVKSWVIAPKVLSPYGLRFVLDV